MAGHGDRGHQPDEVGPGDRMDLGAILADPRDDAAVVEPQAQYRSHRHLAAQDASVPKRAVPAWWAVAAASKALCR